MNSGICRRKEELAKQFPRGDGDWRINPCIKWRSLHGLFGEGAEPRMTAGGHRWQNPDPCSDAAYAQWLRELTWQVAIIVI